MAKPHPFALAALAISYFILGISSLAVVGLARPMARDLAVDAGAIAQLVTLFAVTYALAAPFLQTSIGNRDRKILLAVGLVTIGLGSIIGALTHSYVVVAFSRVIMALGGALVGPMASAAGAAIVPEHQRGEALGKVFAGMTLATVMGVPMASWAGQIMGWQIVIAAIGFASFAVAGFVMLALPAGRAPLRPSLADLKAIITDRVLAPAIGVTLLQMGAQFITYSVIGAYLVSAQAIAPDMIPIALLVFGIGGVIGNGLATKLISRLGHDVLILASLVFLACVFTGFVLLEGSGTSALIGVGAWAIAGTLMMAPQQARLVTLSPAAGNLLLALNASALYLGMAAGSAAAGLLIADKASSNLPTASAVTTMLALISFAVSRHLANRMRAAGPSSSTSI